jgi:hypothetical protein
MKCVSVADLLKNVDVSLVKQLAIILDLNMPGGYDPYGDDYGDETALNCFPVFPNVHTLHIEWRHFSQYHLFPACKNLTFEIYAPSKNIVPRLPNLEKLSTIGCDEFADNRSTELPAEWKSIHSLVLEMYDMCIPECYESLKNLTISNIKLAPKSVRERELRN